MLTSTRDRCRRSLATHTQPRTPTALHSRRRQTASHFHPQAAQQRTAASSVTLSEQTSATRLQSAHWGRNASFWQAAQALIVCPAHCTRSHFALLPCARHSSFCLSILAAAAAFHISHDTDRITDSAGNSNALPAAAALHSSTHIIAD